MDIDCNLNAINFISQSKKIIAISNYRFSKEIEEYIAADYDCILRFNIGSNLDILNKEIFFNKRVDVACLSGWRIEDFGPKSGFKNQKILVTRPKYSDNLMYRYKDIGVKPIFEKHLSAHTTNICYIPYEVCVDLYNKYNYDHPTSGLLTLYYIKNYLNENIEGINFFLGDNLYNDFSKSNGGGHDIEKEKLIFKDLNINNIKII